MVKDNGRAVAVRAEYAIAPLACGYPDAPDSIPLNCPRVSPQGWKYSTILT